MNKRISSALLISTYNRSDALQRCLESVLVQVQQPDEVLIADDGSDEDTRRCVQQFSKGFAGKCAHLWQPHQGFRVAQIRNKALRAATADYIVQIDGDMVLHPGFIADHLYLAERSFYLRGNKYLLSEEETSMIVQKGMDAFKTLSFPLGRSAKSRRILLLRNLFHRLHIDIKGGFGSNMAYWLTDAIAINGYNNNFEGWGSEDDDFIDRLRMAGVRCKSIKFAAIAYHLHHPPADRSFAAHNNELRHTYRTTQGIKAENGYHEV